MDQTKLKAKYEATCSGEKTKENFSELTQKLNMVLGGFDVSEVTYLVNARTGEKLYVPCTRRTK